MKYDNKTVITTGLTAAACGLVAAHFWPLVQGAFGHLITPTISIVATWGAIIGFLVVMGYAKFGVISINGTLRNAGYMIGMIAFLITLIPEKNTGAVFLETFLLYVTTWGLIKARSKPEPFETTSKKFWVGTLKLVIFVGLGLLAAHYWPVDSKTQLQGGYWKWVALVGGLANAAALFLVEMRFFKDIRHYSRWYILSCGVVCVSYLGEYNYCGVVLHTSLWLMAVYVAWVEPRFKKA